MRMPDAAPRHVRAANAAAIAVILMAGALSATWAFIVPIFQAPDEPAHFDYAMSIYGARRLIRSNDGKVDWIVSPYTTYLLQASQFNRIQRHSSMRVPAHYGSASYFARVDAEAPSLREPILPNGRISYVMPFYPPGFYALEAVWMGVVAKASNSIVATFFAGRLLCVFLLMLSLYYNYRTALNLGVPSWLSVGLIGAIGFFPMTSFVSSYIQPDDLAYALVSASLFYATQLRGRALDFWSVFPLGLSLGLLAITKYQFFVSVAIPSFLFVGSRLLTGVKASTRWRVLLGLGLPTVVLLLLAQLLVGQFSNARSGLHSDALLAYFRSVLASGVLPTLRYLAVTTVGAFVDFFIYGSCAAGYWQVMGWFDTPLVILNGQIEMLLRLGISLITIVVAVVVGFGVVTRARLLVRAGARHHISAALRVAFGDPVFTSYLCFILTMFTLYVLTANAFAAEGRHFYPFIFPAFLCLIWYAPRILNKRRHAMNIGLTLALLLYVAVAAPYALGDVIGRYYGPQTAGYVAVRPDLSAIKAKRAVGLLYPIENARYHVNNSYSSFNFEPGTTLFISGLLLPSPGSTPLAAIVLDRHVPVPVLSGQYEQNLAEMTHSVEAGYGGFRAYLNTKPLAAGPHRIAAYARVGTTNNYERIVPERIFFLTGPDGRFSEAELKAIEHARIVQGDVWNAGICRGTLSVISGLPTLSSGSVLLLTGLLGRANRYGYDAAWVMADGRPYPGTYDESTGTFAATIDTTSLAPGVYRGEIYLMRNGNAALSRLLHAVSFRVLPLRNSGELLTHLNQRACEDPLAVLAGTS